MSSLKNLQKNGVVPDVLLKRIESDWSVEAKHLEPQCQATRIFCSACGFCSNEYYVIQDLRNEEDGILENRDR